MDAYEKPHFGNCYYCGQDKLDCLPINGAKELLLVCAACRWVRTPKPEPRVYGRNASQSESVSKLKLRTIVSRLTEQKSMALSRKETASEWGDLREFEAERGFIEATQMAIEMIEEVFSV